MTMSAMAQQYLSTYALGEAPAGVAWGKALQQARLDFSAESLTRLDALLRQIRQQLRPEFSSFANESQTQNFALMLAFYMGEYIARRSANPIRWHSYEEAVAVLPSDFGLPQGFFSFVVGIVGGQVCLPLGYIQQALFGEDAGAVSDYIDTMLKKLENSRQRDGNDWCALYLERFHNNQNIPGGLLLREQLQRAGLDFTRASLDRIDTLLLELRQRNELDYARCVSEQEYGNILMLLAFYLGSTIARLGNLSMRWIDWEQAEQAHSGLERSFETSQVCVLADRLYFPLGLLTEILFEPDPMPKGPLGLLKKLVSTPPARRTCRGFADQILSSVKSDSRPLGRPAVTYAGDAAVPVDPHWLEATEQAGFLAAYCMFMVSQGAPLEPTLLCPAPGTGQGTLVSLMGETVDSSLQIAAGRLQDNPDKLPWQILCYDGYALLGTGKTDGLIMELACYGKEPLRLTLLFPYRNAADQQGFAIYRPRQRACSASVPQYYEILAPLLYKGIQGFRHDQFKWDDCLLESI